MNRYRNWIVVGILIFATQLFAAGRNPNQSFQVTKGGTLEVSVSEGDLLITPWEKNEVSVRVSGLQNEDWEGFRVFQNGNTVVVRGDGSVYRIEVSVPSQFNLDLDTSSGEIEIHGAMTGNLRGSTSGGDIRLGDVGNQIDMDTSGGNVSVGKITGDAVLHTSGGDVNILSSTGILDVATAGGDVSIGNVLKALKARSGGGTIEIGDVGGTAAISTGGGDLIVGKVSGNVELSTGGGSVQLAGGGGDVLASTGGGDIALTDISGKIQAKTGGGDISLQNVSGPVDAKTAGGDILADLTAAGQGVSRMTTSGGSIELRIPASASATIEALIHVRGRWADGLEESEIISDFKAASHEEDASRKEIRSTFVLNAGGHRIQLETINGTIAIRKK